MFDAHGPGYIERLENRDTRRTETGSVHILQQIHLRALHNSVPAQCTGYDQFCTAGANGRTEDTQAKDENEQVVEPDIEHAGQDLQIRRNFYVARTS